MTQVMFRNGRYARKLHSLLSHEASVSTPTVEELAPKNCTITSLDLSHNRIGPTGGTALARALQHKHSKIRELCFENTHVGSTAFHRIVAAVASLTGGCQRLPIKSAVSTKVYTQVHRYVYTQVYAHIYTHVCTHVHTCLDMHSYLYTCLIIGSSKAHPLRCMDASSNALSLTPSNSAVHHEYGLEGWAYFVYLFIFELNEGRKRRSED